MVRPATRARSQATLIGGTILLIVLVAVVLPTILNMVNTSTVISESVKQIAQVRLEAYREKVQVLYFANETAAGIFVNNTGTTKVVIERVILLNLTSGEPISDPLICGTTGGICGLINIPHANKNPLVKNAPPLYDTCLVGILRGGNPENIACLDNSGKVAILNPGDVLYISIDPYVAQNLRNVVVYAESAYGVIHPVVTIPPNATGFGGGGPAIPKEAIPTGLFTPISGYILWGYDDLTNYTYAQQEHPPFRISTLGPHPRVNVKWETDTSRNQRLYCGGIPFDTAGFDLNTIRYLGTYNVTFTVATTSYLYVYADGGWYAIELEPGDSYTIVGYVGAIGLMSPQVTASRWTILGACPYSDYDQLLVLDGWAWDVLINGRSIRDLYGLRPATWNYPAVQTQLINEGAISESDYDNNNITEEHVTSFRYDGTWDGLDLDGTSTQSSTSGTIYTYSVSASYGYSDDVSLINLTILRDITGVDAVEVAVKVGFQYDFLLAGMSDDTPAPTAYLVKPVVAVGLLRLDPETLSWRLIDIETKEFTLGMPKTFWINVMFPVNRTDVYRVVIYLYDPYGLINIGANALHGWCESYTTWGWAVVCTKYANILSTLETHFYLEHVIVQYYVYNPLLKRLPVVYLVNITGVPYWPDGVNTAFGRFGYINETMLKTYWTILLDRLQRMGIYPVVISDWDEFQTLLGTRTAPRDAVVLFLHGPILPWKNGLKLYNPITDSYTTVHSASDFVIWLADMIRGRGWVVVFPYGPPLAFDYETSSGSLDTAPVSGSLLSTMLQRLYPDIPNLGATYIYVKTGGFSYQGGVYSLDNYTVGIGSKGIDAAKTLRFWLIPRFFGGNYSVVSGIAAFYDLAEPLWLNETPPPGYDSWAKLGIPSNGYALGAGYLNVTTSYAKGALVLVAAPRPGVTPPERLAGLDILAGLYVWKQLHGK